MRHVAPCSGDEWKGLSVVNYNESGKM